MSTTEFKKLAKDAGDELRIYYVPLSQLANHFLEKNSKKHDIGTLHQSFDRHAFRDPIAFDITLNGGKGGIVEGNGRLELLCQLRESGFDPPKGIKATKDDWLVPCIFGMDAESEQDAIAYSISHNLSPMWGSEMTFMDMSRLFDQDLLTEQLVGLADMSIDLLPIGIDSEDFSMLLDMGNYSQPEEKPEEDQESVNDLLDKAEDGKIESRVKLGEIWQLGRHKICCGDSTDEGNVRKLLDGKLADCCWTDPPYGVSYVGKTSDSLTIENDGAKDLPVFIAKSFNAINTALKPGSAIYVAHPAGALQQVFLNNFIDFFTFRQQLIWVKNAFALGRSDYHYRHEPILFGYTRGGEGRNGRGGDKWYGDNAQDSVFEVKKPNRNGEHPTMKPIELIQAMISNSSGRNALLFEPFSGSGSTMIAAQQMEGDRTVYGFELSEAYCEVICQRFQSLTGIEPKLIGHL